MDTSDNTKKCTKSSNSKNSKRVVKKPVKKLKTGVKQSEKSVLDSSNFTRPIYNPIFDPSSIQSSIQSFNQSSNQNSKKSSKNGSNSLSFGSNSTSISNELLEHNPNKVMEQLIVRKKPSFDLSFMKKSQSECLITNLDKFLNKVPNSSSSSDASSQNASSSRDENMMTNNPGLPKFDDLKIDPMNMESIDEHMKIASEEFYTKSCQEQALEIQMQLCPFSKIPSFLLPTVSSDSDDSSDSGDTRIENKNPDKMIQMLD